MKRKKSKKLKKFCETPKIFVFTFMLVRGKRKKEKKTPTTPREKALLNITQI
jgi:hypothetical protein